MPPLRVQSLRPVCNLLRPVWFVALMVWLAASACNDRSVTTDQIGGQTGDTTGLGDEDMGPPLGGVLVQCGDQETEAVASLDEELPELGFAPAQILEWVADGVDSTLLWAPYGGVQTEPESGTGSVQLTFEYDGGEILLIKWVSADTEAEDAEAGAEGADAEAEGAAPEADSAAPEADSADPEAEGSADADCPVALEIEVKATLRTPGGAFDETFPVRLTAYVPEVVSFEGELAMGSLLGTLQLQFDQKFELSGFWVSGNVNSFGSSGAIQSIAAAQESEEGSGVVVAAPPPTIAVWPAPGDCVDDAYGGGSLSVEEDADWGGYSVAVAHQALSALEQEPLKWGTGEETQLSLQFAEPAKHCVRVDSNTGNVTLSFGVTVHAATSDQRWDAEYDGRIDVLPDSAGQLGSLQLTVNLEGSAEEFDAAGLPDLSIEGYDRFELGLSVYSELTDETTSGNLWVNAIRGEPCRPALDGAPLEEEALTPACDEERESLAEASIGAATIERVDSATAGDEPVGVDLSQDE